MSERDYEADGLFFKTMKPPTTHDDFKPMQRQLPLTIEEIAKLFDVQITTLDTNANIFKLIDAVRKVEKAHGIN